MTAREYLKNYKKTNPCQMCGESRPYCLVFHHTKENEKEHTISKMGALGSLDKIKKEISKCILICANCHLEIHQNKYSNKDINKNFYKSRLKILIAKWEKGMIVDSLLKKLITDSVFQSKRTHRGKVTYSDLEQTTGWERHSLVDWHNIYKKYPDKDEYIREIAEPQARNWVKGIEHI